MFTFGIGSSVNRFLIEGLARAGFGEPFVVTKKDEAPQTAARFREYIQTPVLTGIDIDYVGFEVYDVEPRSVPDVFAERPIIVFGKYRGQPNGSVEVLGHRGTEPYTNSIAVSKLKPRDTNRALRYLWARHRIAALGDYQKLRPNSKYVEEITGLGLTYNLLTQYTSFVAVDDVVRNPSGEAKSVKQPLPLPKGVTNAAVGGSVPTIPEPETYALLLLLGLLLLWGYRERICSGLASVGREE